MPAGYSFSGSSGAGLSGRRSISQPTTRRPSAQTGCGWRTNTGGRLACAHRSDAGRETCVEAGQVRANQSAAQRPSGVARFAALAAVLAAAVLAGLLLFGGGDGYTVTARFINAGQLVKGNQVDVAGTEAGIVKDFEITDDGQADVTLEIDEKYAPLRAGTRAVIRQGGQASPANRYVQLMLPAEPEAGTEIRDGGRIAHRQDHHQRGPGPVLQHLRPADAQGAPGLLQGRPAPVRRPRRGGQPRPALPEPAARRVEPPVPRAAPRPAGAGALPGRQLALRDRSVLAP